MPIAGCTLLTQLDVITFDVATALGFGALPVPVPAAPSLIGAGFFCQVLSLSPSGLNATTGLRLTIGR